MHEIPSLEYKYSDLEPYIDEETMRIHHTRHHQTYVDKLNQALEKYPDLSKKSVEELLRDLEQVPEEIRIAVRNNGGGHFNHSFFWKVIGPKKDGDLREATISAFDQAFGGYDSFKAKFKEAALGQFGSGWAWVVANGGRLEIMPTANQDSPISQGKIPVLAIDVWEHAYYLKYQNKRADYVDAFFNVINWDAVEKTIKNSIAFQ